jgi:hypothetical protein
MSHLKLGETELASELRNIISDAPIMPTGEAINANNLRIYDYKSKQHNEHKQKLADFTQILWGCLRPDVRARCDPESGDCHRMSAKEMMEALQQHYSKATDADVTSTLLDLAKPLRCPSKDAVAAIIALQRKSFRFLARQQQEPTAFVKEKYLRDAVSGTLKPTGGLAFEIVMSFYTLSKSERSHTALGNILQEEADTKDYADTPPPATMGDHFGNGAAGITPPRPPKVFCHTHGMGGHTSVQCTNPAPEHLNTVLAPTAEHPNGIRGLYRGRGGRGG